MASTDPNLAALSDEDRQLVESWLVEFDQLWDPMRLSAFVRKLPPQGDPLRLPALIEFVKIDLERCWGQGQPVRLEKYLESLPELGTPETVPAGLIVAEYEVRRQFGAPVDLSALAERFPNRLEEFRRLLEQGEEKHSDLEMAPPPKASLPPNVPTPLPSGLVAAANPSPEQMFGRYRIVKKLSEGGMGSVYLAHDTQLDRPVALKVPKLKTEDNSTILPESLERFYREARAAATLDHPNICPVYDFGEINGIHYLTMAYVEGKALSEFLISGYPQQPRRVALLIHRLAVALDEAHRKGAVHRDLKPANIMINQRNEPVIMDFGLARRINKGDNRLTQLGAIVGSPAYMSPEQVDGDTDAVGPSSDIYSLGVVMYELLTGKLPVEGHLFAVLHQIAKCEPEPPSKYQAHPDPRIEAICLKAMAKRSEDRYRTMAEMAEALLDYLRDDAPSSRDTASRAPVSTAPSGTPRPSQAEDQRPILDSRGEEASPKSWARRFWRQFTQAKRRIKPPRWRWIAAGAAAILILGIVIVIRTDQREITIEVNGPKATDLKVEVDGNTVDVAGLGQPLRLKLGEHTLRVTANDFEVEAPDSFTVRRWGNPVVKVTLVRKPPVLALGWVEDNWLREVSALPAKQQVDAVRAKLPQRNPNFDGTFKPQIENGVVTAIELNGATMQDLSPLLVFSGLQKLDCSCPDPWQSPLADLSPLARLPLRFLRYPYHTRLGAEQLRSIKTLETINDQPAAVFWKQVEAEAKEFEIFRREVARLTPEEQVKAVANRLKERNPGFDGKLVEPRIDNGAVLELRFPADAVVDFSPCGHYPNCNGWT